MDNGPKLTANGRRDWCRLGGSGASYIELGSPWENPFVESFGSRIRDEVLAVEAVDSLLEAKTMIEDWEKHLQHHPDALRPRLKGARRLRGRLGA